MAVFTLGPDNAFLISNDDYEYQDVAASEGIAPTWDAGVILLPAPADPSDPADSVDPAGPGDGDADTGNDESPGGSLPMTGTNLALLLAALGLALLLTGVLYARHRKASRV